jgi:hypothetical protein
MMNLSLFCTVDRHYAKLKCGLQSLFCKLLVAADGGCRISAESVSVREVDRHYETAANGGQRTATSVTGACRVCSVISFLSQLTEAAGFLLNLSRFAR